MLLGLREAYPDRPEFRHAEGNSASPLAADCAHLKASAMGSSATVIIENGKLLLGTWQALYFCESDPFPPQRLPRNRKFYMKVVGE